MPNFSLPRRIWRILYPPLIYLLVSFVVVFVGSVIQIAQLILDSSVDNFTDPMTLFPQVMEIMTSNLMLFQLITVVICFCIFAPMWWAIRKKTPNEDVCKLNIPLVVLTVFAGLSASLFVGSILTITNLTELFQSYNEITSLLTEGSIILQILAVILIGPIVEELIFRGIIFNRLLGWTPTWAAVLIQSALFGLIHLNILQSSYAFLIGVALSLLYLRFRNLWVPIIGHIAFNSAGYIVNGLLSAVGVEEINDWFILAPSAVICVTCIWFLTKLPSRRAENA